MRLLPLCCLSVVLTQCVDPYGNPMSPFGPGNPRPYTDVREQYRTDMREQDRGMAQQAYERGIREGTDDGRSGLPRNTQQNPYGYTSTQGRAYADGYEQGYRSAPPQRGPGLNAPPYPGQGYSPPGQGYTPPGQAPVYPSQGQGQGYTPPAPPPSQQSNDPGYSQGYEYGLRDQVAGRQADAGAHVGAYDPRYRRSFEKGYYDAFEARR